MIEIKAFQVQLAGNATTPLGSITVPTGETITVLETGYRLSATGRIKGFLKERLIDEVTNFIAPDADNRVVRNLEMKPGDVFSFEGTDESGSLNTMAVIIVFDRIITAPVGV